MSTCSSDRLLSACNTSILNIRMASNGFRPALLFLSSPGVSTTASMSARKLSHRTRRSMASSGSPIAEQGFQALIGIEKSQLPHRRLCESKSHASDSHRPGEAAICRGAHYSLSRATSGVRSCARSLLAITNSVLCVGSGQSRFRGPLPALEALICPQVAPISIASAIVDTEIVEIAVDRFQSSRAVEVEDDIGIREQHCFPAQDAVVLAEDPTTTKIVDDGLNPVFG